LAGQGKLYRQKVNLKNARQGWKERSSGRGELVGGGERKKKKKHEQSRGEETKRKTGLYC